MEIKLKSGDKLPGVGDVTSKVDGSTFAGWKAYDNGVLTTYSTVPGENNKVLYASFEGGNGGSQGGGHQSEVIVNPEDPGQPEVITYYPSSKTDKVTSGFGFKFGDDTYMAGAKADDFGLYQQFVITNRSFVQGQTFKLCDFGNNEATWTISIDPYSFGGSNSEDTTWKAYINHENDVYTVLQNFDVESVYIKINQELGDQVYFQLAK